MIFTPPLNIQLSPDYLSSTGSSGNSKSSVYMFRYTVCIYLRKKTNKQQTNKTKQKQMNKNQSHAQQKRLLFGSHLTFTAGGFFGDPFCEAPALFKRNGMYYAVSTHKNKSLE